MAAQRKCGRSSREQTTTMSGFRMHGRMCSHYFMISGANTRNECEITWAQNAKYLLFKVCRCNDTELPLNKSFKKV